MTSLVQTAITEIADIAWSCGLKRLQLHAIRYFGRSDIKFYVVEQRNRMYNAKGHTYQDHLYMEEMLILSSVEPLKDKRKLKTQKLLNMAVLSLLKEHSFRKITIEDICNEALTGRATFYAHFSDKYDLLRFWLPSFWQYEINRDDPYPYIEKTVNRFFSENESIITNILDGAEDKTLRVLSDYLFSVLAVSDKKHIDKKTFQRYAVTSNIYIGGILNYIAWHVKNLFPTDIPVMNKYFYTLIKCFYEWYETSEDFRNE